jgi:hypothetical protein
VRFPGPAVALLLVLLAAFACDTGPAPPNLATASPPVSPPPAATPVASNTGTPAPALPGSLPNHRLTPGETFAGVTAQQVCVSGYAGRARNVLPEQYRQVYASYGISYPEPSGTYELDHLVPLELGGDNTNGNLWPEPAAPVPGFHQKDQLENYLHDVVCGGRMALADAQAGIASDWIALYRLYIQA